MTYPYPGDMVVICDAILAKIEAQKATFVPPVLDTYFGDQDRFPRTPSVCVEPADKSRTLAGVPNMTENEFIIYILVYHNKVQGNETTRREVDSIAYDIEFLLHQDLQLVNTGTGVPRLIHGFVRSHESGYTFKDKTLYRTARLTFYGKNKTSLPVA